MSKLHIFGFVAVCGVACFGVDYYTQSKNVDGPLGISGYAQTFVTRFQGFKSDQRAAKAEQERKQRWREGGKPYLPGAPAGWHRRSLTDGDNSAVMAVKSQFDAMNKPSAAAEPVALGLAKANAAHEAKKADRRGWVYENGEEIVWIDVTTKSAASKNTMTGLVIQTVNGMGFDLNDTSGFAVIGGVGFTEDLGNKYESAEPRPYRKIIGRIGLDEEVIVRVNAQASDQSIKTLLSGVDFDGLNALLQIPIETVSNATKVAPEAQPELALQMADLHTEFRALQAEMAQMKMKNMDQTAMLVNTVTQGYGSKDGLMDITGGKVQDMRASLQVGYRNGLSKLMETRQAVLDEAPSASVTKSMFASLSSIFSGFGGGAEEADAPAPAKVTVRKGGGGSNCSIKGTFKTCSRLSE